MAHGAAHDPAQHVAAALVARQHAVGDQEGRGAQVVGDHPVGGLVAGSGARETACATASISARNRSVS